MSKRPDGQGVGAPKGRRWHSLPWRNPRDPLTVMVRYRGGPEGWIEVHARGSMGRFPGHVSLFDALAEVWQWDRKPGPSSDSSPPAPPADL